MHVFIVGVVRELWMEAYKLLLELCRHRQTSTHTLAIRWLLSNIRDLMAAKSVKLKKKSLHNSNHISCKSHKTMDIINIVRAFINVNPVHDKLRMTPRWCIVGKIYNNQYQPYAIMISSIDQHYSHTKDNGMPLKWVHTGFILMMVSETKVMGVCFY